MITENEMKKSEVPAMHTIDEVHQYIEELVNREHDYGTCVYALSMASHAAFRYVAHKLGVTGFQASCADLDFIRRTRLLNGPFILLNGRDLLYPQYNLRDELEKFIGDSKEWLSSEASKLIKENPNAHPDVIAHWKKLEKS